jgi:DNA-3-methyladenine glycosylase I
LTLPEVKMSRLPDGIKRGEDGCRRCWWAGEAADYVAYHDHEWGRPVTDDRRLFEKLCLEGFQSGLSWLTILRKRDNFRRAFASFDFARVARFTRLDVDRLLLDAGIVRHRGKIEATVNNARHALDLVEEFGSLAAFFWHYEPTAGSRPRRVTRKTLTAMTSSPESVAMSKDLKRRGFSFVGPTTAYAFMQAMGLVNDHLDGCHVRAAAEQERTEILIPG